MCRENYIGFVPNSQNHGKWTFSIEEFGRNPAGPYPLYRTVLHGWARPPRTAGAPARWGSRRSHSRARASRSGYLECQCALRAAMRKPRVSDLELGLIEGDQQANGASPAGALPPLEHIEQRGVSAAFRPNAPDGVAAHARDEARGHCQRHHIPEEQDRER